MKYLLDSNAKPMFITSGHFNNEIDNFAGGERKFSSLPRLLKVMLSSDGTLSKAVESAFGEPIAIDLLDQQKVETPDGNLQIVRRDINLLGLNTNTRYTFARSYVDLSAVPKKLVSELEETGKGVGWLLRKLNHEQFREVFALGWSKDLSVKEHPQGIDLGVYRVYCITCNERRFMEITEHYPIDLYI